MLGREALSAANENMGRIVDVIVDRHQPAVRFVQLRAERMDGWANAADVFHPLEIAPAPAAVGIVRAVALNGEVYACADIGDQG